MKLWISNLDRSSLVEDIQELFTEFGEITQVVKMNEPDEGKDTFSAMVEMAYAGDAEDAIADLNGEQFDGQTIKVKAATEAQLALLAQDSLDSKPTDEDSVETELEDGQDDVLPMDEDDPAFEPKGWEPITRKRPGKNNRDW